MSFKFKRMIESEPRTYGDLGLLLGSKAIDKERWLFVIPHDDDAIIGGGLWLRAAIEAGVDVYLLVITDGRNGYCSMEQQHTIVEARRQELFESCKQLGMKEENVFALGYPDGGLFTMQGRRLAEEGEPNAIAGYVGIQNTMTYYMRKVRPDRLFVPGASDYHPDHQVVHNELMISIFHANGTIWPELGEPCPVPEVYEMAIYCDFATPPNLELTCDSETFQIKLDGITAYKSQTQITQLVDNIRKAGAIEYLHEVNFKFYSANTYKLMFNEKNDVLTPEVIVQQ